MELPPFLSEPPSTIVCASTSVSGSESIMPISSNNGGGKQSHNKRWIQTNPRYSAINESTKQRTRQQQQQNNKIGIRQRQQSEIQYQSLMQQQQQQQQQTQIQMQVQHIIAPQQHIVQPSGLVPPVQNTTVHCVSTDAGTEVIKGKYILINPPQQSLVHVAGAAPQIGVYTTGLINATTIGVEATENAQTAILDCCPLQQKQQQQQQKQQQQQQSQQQQQQVICQNHSSPTIGLNFHYQTIQPIQSPLSTQQTTCSGDSTATNNGSSNNPGDRYVLQSSQQQHSPPSNSPTISVDDDMPYNISGNTGLGHTARAPPETLEWLSNNYEPCEGASLPRCTLYDHYITHCKESGLEPVNAASFGKLIRSVFKGLRTRRLGTRGNSKYHYNGIRIKPSSSLLNAVSAEEYSRMNPCSASLVHQTTTRNPRRISGAFQQVGIGSTMHSNNNTSSSSYHLRRHADSSNSIGNDYCEESLNDTSGNMDIFNNNNDYIANSDIFSNDSRTSAACTNNQLHGRSDSMNSTSSNNGRMHAERGNGPSGSGNLATGNSEEQQSTMVEIVMALGTGQVPRVPMPNFEELESSLIQFGYTIPHALKFIDTYTSNCAKVLDSIKHLRFDTIEGIWTNFWQFSDTHDQLNNTDEEMSESTAINFDQLLIYRLCSLTQIQKYIETMDLAFYQVIVEVLIPDVLRTTLTPRLSCQIRNFAKNVEQSLKKAMGNAPMDIKKSKCGTIRLLANALTRYTSFNHLADAARAVLLNKEQISQMYNDFCKVDFAIVRGQADWVCNCDSTLILSIENDFKENLRLQRNLDEWTEWMEAVVDQVLAKYHDKPISIQMDVSKQFLLKWSFYSSMILRDVTYRSAQSFGSFHLIRLLYDEYMCLLVEMRLAKAMNQPMIGVMRPNWLQNLPQQHQSQFMQIVGTTMDTSGSSVQSTSLNTYYHNIPLTPSHQHLHHPISHHLHPQQDIIVSSSTPSMISLNTHGGAVRISDIPASSIYDNGIATQQQQIINTEQPIYSSSLEIVAPSNYELQQRQHQQQQQQQIIIHSAPAVSTQSATIHYMLDNSSLSTVKYSSNDNTASSSSVSAPPTTINPIPMSLASTTASTYATSTISLLDATENDGRQNELSEILVQDPRLSSVDHGIHLHHRSNSFSDDNEQYMMLNSHHMQQQQLTEHQMLMADDQEFTAMTSVSSGMTSVVTSTNSTISSSISGYHHETMPQHHHSLGTIVYIQEEEMMETNNISSHHHHHQMMNSNNDRSDMDELIGDEENLLNTESQQQSQDNNTKFNMNNGGAIQVQAQQASPPAKNLKNNNSKESPTNENKETNTVSQPTIAPTAVTISPKDNNIESQIDGGDGDTSSNQKGGSKIEKEECTKI